MITWGLNVANRAITKREFRRVLYEVRVLMVIERAGEDGLPLACIGGEAGGTPWKLLRTMRRLVGSEYVSLVDSEERPLVFVITKAGREAIHVPPPEEEAL